MKAQGSALNVLSHPGRIEELDAPRGLAAFVVIWCHFRFAFQDVIPNTWLTLLVRPLFSGHESVTLFFILSGYVLALPVWNGRQPPYFRYLVRRTSRIYVPFLAAMLLAALGSSLFSGIQVPLTPWFHHTWSQPVTAHLIASQLLIPENAQLNTAFWSLRYEMEMSIIFPFLCYLLLRIRWFGGLALIAATTVAVRLATAAAHGIEPEWVEALRWSEFFVAGAILSMRREWIAAFFARLSTAAKWILFTLSVGLYYSYFATFYSGNRPNEAPRDTLIGLGAIGFLLFAQYSSAASKILKRPALRYLGRVSYSLYLVHGTILFAMLHLLYGKVPLWGLAAIYLPVTFLATHLFYITVEEPATRLGKALSRSGMKKPVPLPLAPLAACTKGRPEYEPLTM
jgi:peptidoglycan/LPS O-acetylase OafA/YrhL